MAETYRIKLETGDRTGAGTDATVRITITGTLGRTDQISLDHFFSNDFERGQLDNYEIKDKDVGELLSITLTNSGFGLYSDWLVNKVAISKNSNSTRIYTFPCFRWVISEMVVFEGTAKLPQNTKTIAGSKQPNPLDEERKKEVAAHQKIYEWGSDPSYSQDLPGFVKAKDITDLPKDARFTFEATGSLLGAGIEKLLNAVNLVQFYNVFDPWDCFDDFRKNLTPGVLSLPASAVHWRNDVWYGKQFLNGCNPEVIRRCDSLPEKFPVTDEMVKGLLDRGSSLEKAMKEGQIYITDYEVLHGIPTMNKDGDKRYIAACIGLFFVRNNGDLVPIAIQLEQSGEANPVFTPNDSAYDWLMAKLWLRTADTQYHQMISHLLRCHLMMEPVSVATWRQLPSLHPVWKLLYPHTKGVMVINTLGRNALISPGGLADQVLSIGGGGHIKFMQRHYRAVTLDTYDIPAHLAKRGVIDAEKLPRFYYRDDALKLWTAIENFITKIIGIYYKKDDDVVEDYEIQNWIRDLHDNGYPFKSEGSVDKKCPKSFKTCEDLIHFLTLVIFTSSCQHAAVNFSQMATYGFHPNSPSLMRQPHPTGKGTSTLETIMQALATKQQSAAMVGIVNELTTVYPTERFLGDYAENLFSEGKAQEAKADFKVELNEISRDIKERNSRLEVPYTYLLPELVPNSIAI